MPIDASGQEPSGFLRPLLGREPLDRDAGIDNQLQRARPSRRSVTLSVLGPVGRQGAPLRRALAEVLKATPLRVAYKEVSDLAFKGSAVRACLRLKAGEHVFAHVGNGSLGHGGGL